MSFLFPQYFWLLLVLLLAMLWRKNRKESDIIPQTRQKLILVYVALFMIVVALSRPVLSEGVVKQEYEGSEVVIALDLSYSMQATDIKPNRLMASKEVIKTLIKERVHDRFALLGFTSNAIILSPLSSDAELLSHQLDLISAETIITKGTNMASVLELSTKLSQVKQKSLIIVGDGADKRDFAKEITFAKDNGLSISMVMMATSAGARLKDKHGNWMKDSSGHLVITAKNESAKTLSSSTGGIFVDEGEDVVSELSSWLDSREKKLSSEAIKSYQELFYYPVFFALLSFVFAITTLPKYLFRVSLVLLSLVGINLHADMREFSTISAGDKAYVKQENLDALESKKVYAQRSPEDAYNLGNAYYKAGQYEEAIDVYKRIRSTSPELKAKVFHNLGNSYIRIEMYEEAKLAFTKSLIIHFDKETNENLLYITRFKKAEGLQTGQQKGEKKNESKKANESSKKSGEKKAGGSSNMKVTANAGAGSKTKGKKSKSDAQVNFNPSQSALSYKQYELINERSVHEENPW